MSFWNDSRVSGVALSSGTGTPCHGDAGAASPPPAPGAPPGPAAPPTPPPGGAPISPGPPVPALAPAFGDSSTASTSTASTSPLFMASAKRRKNSSRTSELNGRSSIFCFFPVQSPFGARATPFLFEFRPAFLFRHLPQHHPDAEQHDARTRQTHRQPRKNRRGSRFGALGLPRLVRQWFLPGDEQISGIEEQYCRGERDELND